jgi:hypothetical protein
MRNQMGTPTPAITAASAAAAGTFNPFMYRWAVVLWENDNHDDLRRTIMSEKEHNENHNIVNIVAKRGTTEYVSSVVVGSHVVVV